MPLKRLITFMLAVLLLLSALSAAAEEAIAPDLSKQCTFDSTYSKVKKSYLVDGKYKTAWESGKALNPYLAMHAKSEPIAGVYVCCRSAPTARTGLTPPRAITPCCTAMWPCPNPACT